MYRFDLPRETDRHSASRARAHGDRNAHIYVTCGQDAGPEVSSENFNRLSVHLKSSTLLREECNWKQEVRTCKSYSVTSRTDEDPPGICSTRICTAADGQCSTASDRFP